MNTPEESTVHKSEEGQNNHVFYHVLQHRPVAAATVEPILPGIQILCALVCKRALCPSANFEGYLKDTFFSAIFKKQR